MRIFVYVILGTVFILQVQKSSCSPFLFNVASVLTSASASSSQPSSGNIADLRKQKTRLAKSAKLEDEKNPLPSDLEQDQFFSENQNTNNEASPSLIQNKIGKILHKIRFLSRFANAGNTAQNNYEIDFEKDQDDFEKDFLDQHNDTETITTLNITTNIDPDLGNQTFIEETESNEVRKNVTTVVITKKPLELGKPLQNASIREGVTPSSIGVFFTELLGSIVGLAYGAVAQFTRPTQTPNEG